MTSKVTNKIVNVGQVEKMLHHFKTYNFININTNKSIQFGFNAENLKEVVKSEWLLANMVFPDHPAFKFKSLETLESLKSAFTDVKNLINTVPFSLVAESPCTENEEASLLGSTSTVDHISSLLKIKNGTILQNLTFCSPADAVEIFYKKQQERKIWWKKEDIQSLVQEDYFFLSSYKHLQKGQQKNINQFSVAPGRFHSSVVTSDDNKSLIGEIQAEFPWGLEIVEIIKYLPEICMDTSNFFEVKNKRKKFTPQVVSCKTCLEKITLIYLCDSYEGLNEESSGNILRFNRKLAPYKVAFAGTGTSAETNKTLEELALFLAKKIRKLRISALLLPDVCSISIERQLIRNDALGIPYTIILNEKTLKDGIIAIRSRDTTLKEQSHVSSVTSYIEKIINS